MQLIYRGQTFNYRPTTLPSTPATAGLSCLLFYRGATYHCQLAMLQPTQLPKAINWRFAVTAEAQKQHLRPAH